MKNRSFILMILCFLCLSTNAQYSIRYGQAIFNPHLVNPAFRWDKQQVNLDMAYRFPWKEGNAKGMLFNMHSTVSKTLGVGIKGDLYSNSAIRKTNQLGMVLDYGWDWGNNNQFRLAGGAGLEAHKYNLKAVSTSIGNTPLNDLNRELLYTEFAAAVQLNALQAGFSSYILSGDYVLHANMKYTLDMNDSFTVQPQVSYVWPKDAKTVFDVGAVLKYNKRFGLGLAYATNDLIHVNAQIGISDMLSFNYSSGIAIGETTYLFKNTHEVGFRVTLNHKY